MADEKEPQEKIRLDRFSWNDGDVRIINPGKAGRRSRSPGMRLWTSYGAESVYFQREAQVNFWTVLGGLAMAALLTQLSPLLGELKDGRWYLVLYMLASILTLANSWVQTAWGSLVLRWPISILSTVIVLFGMLAQSIQCLLITQPAGWLAASATILFFAVALQWRFEGSGALKAFDQASIRRFHTNNLVYLAVMLVCLAGGYHLWAAPSPLAEAVWGFAALLIAFAALLMQHVSMKKERAELGIP
jgi:hypothetical protein